MTRLGYALRPIVCKVVGHKMLPLPPFDLVCSRCMAFKLGEATDLAERNALRSGEAAYRGVGPLWKVSDLPPDFMERP